jgi:uncharacterized protein YdaU (DUF1376 family)
MNFYKRHLGDLAKSCGDLSQGQMGAFDLLLDWHYGNEKPLPKAKDKLYRIGRATTKAERENVDSVIAELFTKTPGGFVHKRALEEMGKANAQAETNRRIAEEREARKRERREHESCDESSTNPSTKRQPSHKPLATSQESNPPESYHPVGQADAGAADLTGQFEGHEHPQATPNPAAAFAIALTRAGASCTSLNPDLLAYVRAGGTVEHLTQCAAHPDCTGKAATYAIRMARRELADQARPIQTGPPRTLTPSRQFTALQAAQEIIDEARDQESRDPEQARRLVHGSDR